jgi:ribosomal protein S18 acetylase RimI-like enzyme
MGSLIQRALQQNNGDLVMQVIRDRADPVLRHYLQPIMKLFQELDYEMSAFHEQAFGVSGESYQFSEDELFEELDQNNILLVVHDLSGVKGLAQVKIEEEGSRTKELVVRYLVVDKEQRGQGVGTHLMNKVMGLADEEKIDHITLGVYIQNEGAVKLYAKFGFRPYYQAMVRKIK